MVEQDFTCLMSVKVLLYFLVLVVTLLTSCRGVHFLRAAPLWPVDGHVGMNVERQRASMATPGRT